MLSLACAHGHSTCMEVAVNKFADWMQNPDDLLTMWVSSWTQDQQFHHYGDFSLQHPTWCPGCCVLHGHRGRVNCRVGLPNGAVPWELLTLQHWETAYGRGIGLLLWNMDPLQVSPQTHVKAKKWMEMSAWRNLILVYAKNPQNNAETGKPLQ